MLSSRARTLFATEMGSTEEVVVERSDALADVGMGVF